MDYELKKVIPLSSLCKDCQMLFRSRKQNNEDVYVKDFCEKCQKLFEGGE